MAFIPQGAEPRTGHRCLGLDYSTFLSVAFLALLVRGYEWDLPHTTVEALMRTWPRILRAAVVMLGLAVASSAAQGPPVRPYAHGGVGVGRFVFLCAECGSPQTALVPSASFGLSFTRIGLDVGLDALGWTHIGDRYTVLTLGTTVRPRWMPLFFGGGVGFSFRQFPDVCSLCPGTPGTPVRIRATATDPAFMAQIGLRISVDRSVALEPFAQYSRMTGAGGASAGYADHLMVGIRIDGRE
jgi:hypothetical protein